jgi:hypothetical protein
MTLGSRLPGVLLLAVVIAAGTLLIAGFGGPVGIGVLVGVALGLAAVLASVAMRPGSSGVSFSVPGTQFSGSEPDHTLIERHGRDFMRVAGVDSGALNRVLAIGTSVEAGGVRVELVALELRDNGVIGLLVAHSRPPVGQVGHFATVKVRDDLDTAYIAAGQGTGGSTGTARHEVRIAPAPPAAARLLTLTVESFADPFPGSASTIEGPWSFEIDLTP